VDEVVEFVSQRPVETSGVLIIRGAGEVVVPYSQPSTVRGGLEVTKFYKEGISFAMVTRCINIGQMEGIVGGGRVEGDA
jgi:hypothetical protein